MRGWILAITVFCTDLPRANAAIGVSAIWDQLDKVYYHRVDFDGDKIRTERNSNFICPQMKTVTKGSLVFSSNSEMRRHFKRLSALSARFGTRKDRALRVNPHGVRYFYGTHEVTLDLRVAPMVRHALEDSCALN